MTQYKLFPALPDHLTDLAKKLLFETDLNEANGRISWPRVMMYEHDNEWGEKIKAPLPPANEVTYNIRVANIEAWEYLCKTGWAYDSKHTGRTYSVIDNRKAPGV